MNDSAFKQYKKLYDETSFKLRTPDVIVFLKSEVETNIKRINHRNREIEAGKIDEGYLKSLHQKYEEFLKKLKSDYKDIDIIVVDTDNKSAEDVFDEVYDSLKKHFGSLDLDSLCN